MKPTNDKVYADTNIILYLFDKDDVKKNIVFDIFEKKPVITTQVINETINNLLKKFGRNPKAIIADIRQITNISIVKFISIGTVELALNIKHRYKYSYYDCLHIASALENNCSILYSEDLQHKQVIENTLTIINPFK